MQIGHLILGKRFGRKEIQRPRLRVAQQPVKHRQVVTERLAARRTGHDDHVPPGLRLFPCHRLMRIESVDAMRGQPGAERRMERIGKRHPLRRARGQSAPFHNVGTNQWIRTPGGEERLQRASRGIGHRGQS